MPLSADHWEGKADFVTFKRAVYDFLSQSALKHVNGSGEKQLVVKRSDSLPEGDQYKSSLYQKVKRGSQNNN